MKSTWLQTFHAASSYVQDIEYVEIEGDNNLIKFCNIVVINSINQ